MFPSALAPVHDLLLDRPGSWDLGAGGFGADGRLYAEVQDSTLNLGNVMAYWWPQVLGAVMGLVFLWLLMRAIRVWRRPQVHNEPHCRRCNYHRAGISIALPCPECGTDPKVRRFVVGRSAGRRLVAPVAVLALSAAVYAAMLIGGTPRGYEAMDRLQWRARWLGRWAERHELDWSTYETMYRSIVAIDPVTGGMSRIVTGLEPDRPFEMSIDPDGRTMIAKLRGGDLAAIDVKTAAMRRRMSRPDRDPNAPPAPREGWWHVAGWAGPDVAYVQNMVSKAGVYRSELYRWDLKTGQRTLVYQPAVVEFEPMDYRDILPALVYVVTSVVKEPGGAGVETGPLIGLERVPTRGWNTVSDMVVRDLSDGGREIRRMSGQFWGEVAPVIGSRSATFVIHESGDDISRNAADIGVWSIGEGKRIGGLLGPGQMHTMQFGPAGLALDEARNRLFVVTDGDPTAVHVIDTSSHRRTGELRLLGKSYPDGKIAISADGRWVAVACTTDVGSRTDFSSHMMIFDLKGLEK